VKMIVTDGNTADCSQAQALIDGPPSACLMADKAYDTNALLELLAARGTQAVIPPKCNRKVQRRYDEYLYKLRHIIENIWQYLRANWLSNRVFEGYDDIIDAACDAWNKLTAKPAVITSIGSRQWAHVGQN